MKRNMLMLTAILATANTVSSQTKLNEQARQLLADRKQQPINYPFAFAVISDVHVGDASSHCCPDTPNNYDGYTYLPDLLSNIEALPVRPEFVISCGDMTDCAFEQEYQFYHDTIAAWMDRTKIPVFSLPGNHDFFSTCLFLEGGHHNYRRWIDNVQYSVDGTNYYDYYFDFGTSRFIAIDDVQKDDTYYWESTARVTGAQLARIEEWLQSSLFSRFTFAHISPFYPFPDPTYIAPGYAELQNLTQVHGVRASFYGHQHYYSNEFVGCLHDQFLVPSNILNGESRGWLSVSTDLIVGECGFSVDYHCWNSSDTIWRTSRVYPEPRVSLPGLTESSCKVYVAHEISAGDEGSPYVVEGPGSVRFVSPDGLVITKGLMSVRNGGTIQIGDPQCINSQ